MFFVCPKCMEKLNIYDSFAKCAEGHTYDKSRFGYYNLLLSDKGGVHGDNAEMVLSRRKFLSAGFYEPLAERIAKTCAALLPKGGTVLDAGCGEGYYTERVFREISHLPITRVAAFDISKEAAKRTARRIPEADVAVASTYRMPVPDGAADLLLNVFSPIAIEETSRVIAGGGYFVMVIPAEEHLFGLKRAVYETPYKNTVDDTAISGFELVSKEELKYPIKLTSVDDIKSLFMMTPYAYRTRPADREKIFSLEELQTDVHFLILVYRKDV